SPRRRDGLRDQDTPPSPSAREGGADMNRVRPRQLPRGLFVALPLIALTAAAPPGAGPAEQKPAAAGTPFIFRDVGEEAGLFPRLDGIQGPAAGWGDVDGDGWLDLYVATFHKDGARANLFFRGDGKGKFRLGGQESLRISTRASAALFADLDNDGFPELYVSSMPQPPNAIGGRSL